jgi:hydrogenase maturation protein HypF
MLPYTPLHHLLLESETGVPEAWVMTSGNRSEEPIVTENEDAREQLGGIAAAFLMHDRPIQARCDDSVLRVAADGELTPIRRARGYAPMPIRTGWASPALLATGTELKNSFCLAQENYAFLSPHIGELQNYETLQAYEETISHYEQLFRVQPRVIAYDLHPDYLATRYALRRAEEQRLAAIAVQHHHAHIAACMAEHGLPAGEPVIGVAFDGAGYGSDGAIWGGEVLLADYVDFQRAYHLDYTPLPGGDMAVRQPWRLGLAWLGQLGLNWDESLLPMRAFSEGGLRTVKHQIEKGVNAPQTSSMGRLFDAAAVLAGLRQTVTYEGQAAIELEALLDPGETGAYYFEIGNGIFDAHPVMAALLADRLAGVPSGRIAARFHNGVAELVLALCSRLRASEGISRVALSGGVWQNATLLTEATRRLQSAGFEVLSHHKVPPNDGGVSLGQAAVATHTLFR